MTNHADTRVDEIVERLKSQGHRALGEIASGSPAELALATAARVGAEMIVLGVTAGARVGRFRVAIVRESKVAVLIVPG